jgi:hypothetical protein
MSDGQVGAKMGDKNEGERGGRPDGSKRFSDKASEGEGQLGHSVILGLTRAGKTVLGARALLGQSLDESDPNI